MVFMRTAPSSETASCYDPTMGPESAPEAVSMCHETDSYFRAISIPWVEGNGGPTDQIGILYSSSKAQDKWNSTNHGLWDLYVYASQGQN